MMIYHKVYDHVVLTTTTSTDLNEPVVSAEIQNGDESPCISGPTIFLADPFDPEGDCTRLRDSMKGLGTDEDTILDILPKRSNSQRQELKKRYQENYEKNLENELESELRGDFEEVVLAMMLPPLDYDCHRLRRAVSGVGTDEGTTMMILGTRTSQQLDAIKDRYKELYDVDLQLAIAGETDGELEGLLVDLLRADRPDDDTVDTMQIKEDAKTLVQDLSKVEKHIVGQEDTLRTVIINRSRAQVKVTFEEYEKICGDSIYSAIDAAKYGDTKRAYRDLALAIQDNIQYYTELLNSCFEGLGTKDSMLISIIVSRSEIDLEDIKRRYKLLYNKTLHESIQSECSLDYKRMLLAIVGDK